MALVQSRTEHHRHTLVNIEVGKTNVVAWLDEWDGHTNDYKFLFIMKMQREKLQCCRTLYMYVCMYTLYYFDVRKNYCFTWYAYNVCPYSVYTCLGNRFCSVYLLFLLIDLKTFFFKHAICIHNDDEDEIFVPLHSLKCMEWPEMMVYFYRIQ